MTESHPTPSAPKIALSIAGFDPSSGAGITADLQVFAAHGLFGTSCITALTVQSTLGVRSITPVDHLIRPTLGELAPDLPPSGIKIGMLGREEGVIAVAASLREHRVPVVLDPVLRSSSGAALLDEAGLVALHTHLLPLVDWITPNRQELSVLSGLAADSSSETETALHALHARHPHLHIVATGGDTEGAQTVDLLFTPESELYSFTGPRIETRSTHGTGCAFSSALLSRLILGDTPTAAVAAAKHYVTEALGRAPGLGHGKGPLALLWPLQA